jgi:hypothetical protein
MTEYEAKTVSIGDLLRYNDPYRRDTRSPISEYCLVLGHRYAESRDPNPTRLFKILITSQNSFRVLNIPYPWLDKL